MSNPRYRGPNGHPQTLGEFVRLDWSIRWSCHRCNLTDMRKADMATALKRHGPNYPTNKFMLEMVCRKCGDKIGLLAESPEDRAENVRVFGMSSQRKPILEAQGSIGAGHDLHQPHGALRRGDGFAVEARAPTAFSAHNAANPRAGNTELLRRLGDDRLPLHKARHRCVDRRRRCGGRSERRSRSDCAYDKQLHFVHSGTNFPMRDVRGVTPKYRPSNESGMCPISRNKSFEPRRRHPDQAGSGRSLWSRGQIPRCGSRRSLNRRPWDPGRRIKPDLPSMDDATNRRRSCAFSEQDIFQLEIVVDAVLRSLAMACLKPARHRTRPRLRSANARNFRHSCGRLLCGIARPHARRRRRYV